MLRTRRTRVKEKIQDVGDKGRYGPKMLGFRLAAPRLPRYFDFTGLAGYGLDTFTTCFPLRAQGRAL